MPKALMLVFFCVIIYPFIPAFLGKALYPKSVWAYLRAEKYVLSRHAGRMFSQSLSFRVIVKNIFTESAWVMLLTLPLLYLVKHEETTLFAAAMAVFPFLIAFHCVQALIMWALSDMFVRAYS
jgi:hypothetical protein